MALPTTYYIDAATTDNVSVMETDTDNVKMTSGVCDVCHSVVGDRPDSTTVSGDMSNLFGSSPTSNHSLGANATINMTDVIRHLEQTFPHDSRTVDPTVIDKIIPDSEGEDVNMSGELLSQPHGIRNA